MIEIAFVLTEVEAECMKKYISKLAIGQFDNSEEVTAFRKLFRVLGDTLAEIE